MKTNVNKTTRTLLEESARTFATKDEIRDAEARIAQAAIKSVLEHLKSHEGMRELAAAAFAFVKWQLLFAAALAMALVWVDNAFTQGTSWRGFVATVGQALLRIDSYVDGQITRRMKKEADALVGIHVPPETTDIAPVLERGLNYSYSQAGIYAAYDVTALGPGVRPEDVLETMRSMPIAIPEKASRVELLATCSPVSIRSPARVNLFLSLDGYELPPPGANGGGWECKDGNAMRRIDITSILSLARDARPAPAYELAFQPRLVANNSGTFLATVTVKLIVNVFGGAGARNDAPQSGPVFEGGK